MDRRQYDQRGYAGGYGGRERQHYQPDRGRRRSRSRDGRGGGRPPDDRGPRPTEMMVKTNYFRLLATANEGFQGEWIQYDVEIRDAIRRKKRGPDGNYLEPWQFELVPKMVRRKNEGTDEISLIEKTVNLDTGTTPLSRRILMKLQRNLLKEEKRYIVVRKHFMSLCTNMPN